MGCSTPQEVTAGHFRGLEDTQYQKVFFFLQTEHIFFTEYNIYTWQQFLQFTYANN
jgi:hypothetical protein